MVAAALRGLPLPEPDASAWPAIAATLAARQRRTRWLVALPAMAAALVVGVAISLFISNQAATTQDAVADTREHPAGLVDTNATRNLIAQNQALEASLRTPARYVAQDGAAALASVELEDLIAMLDLQLGASSDPRETAALWQQRLVLMEELAQLRSPSSAVLADNGGALQPAAYLVD